MAELKVLPNGLKYFCYILHYGSHFQKHTNEDEATDAENKAIFILEKLKQFGYVSNYLAIRDGFAGASIFEEHFDALENSLFTVILLTPAFLRNSWDTYCQNSAFYELLQDGQSYRLLPIAIGIEKGQVPRELNIKRVLFLNTNRWKTDDKSWAKLNRALVSGIDNYNSRNPATDCLSIMIESSMPEIRIGISDYVRVDDGVAESCQGAMADQGPSSQTHLKEVDVPAKSDEGLETMSSLGSMLSSGFSRLVSSFLRSTSVENAAEQADQLPRSDDSRTDSSLRLNVVRTTCYLLSKPDQPFLY
ncbi:uncharacterized protein LOC121384468 [Gigantopelta aegis]|uniref:uncharacterized protein LOC121384468 n=1 Tax=Gigantopelta aegis TaxID=1735272 RepID=UPI001B88AA86|nr:uncharacterized protein LOC121384468 [Gigantopelta aegis]